MSRLALLGTGLAGPGAVAFAPSDISGMVFDHDCDLIPGSDGDAIAAHTFEMEFSQSTAGKRPVLKTGGNGINGHNVLRFSGAQAWRSTAAIDLTATNGATVFVVAKVTTGGGGSTILYEFGTSVSATGGLGWNFGSSDNGNATLNGNVGLSIGLTANAALLSTPAAMMYTGLHDMSQTTLEAKGFVNGARVTTNPTWNANNTGNFGNNVFFVGARNEGSLYLTMDLARIVAYNRALTTAEKVQVESYLTDLYSLETTTAESPFADNGHPEVFVGTDKKPYIRTTSGARLVYTTEATTVDVTHYNDIYGSFPGSTEIGVRIDGADYGVISATATGEQTQSAYALGSGAKTVEFINGPQSSPGGGPPAAVIGTFIRGLSFNAAAVDVTASEPASPRIWVYGDSITSGFNATDPSLEGWVQLVRNAYDGSIINDSWGWRALYRDAATSDMRTDFAAYIASLSPSIIWLAIGTNDYGISLWTHTDFGTAYADLLDKIHALLPSATIYCQTPIDRTSEGANAVGSTMAQYRTEITNAANARSGYCVAVDGTTFLGTGDLDDGVHPTTAGHALYATAVIAELGL